MARSVRRSNTSRSNKKREWMSTTTCVAPVRSVSSTASSRSGSPVAARKPACTRIVSQKMLAVSASAIGVWRCSGVRSARLVLWYACPSSWASVDTLSNVPPKFMSTRLSSPRTGMQNAPPRLPSRASASTQCSSNARCASDASAGE